MYISYIMQVYKQNDHMAVHEKLNLNPFSFFSPESNLNSTKTILPVFTEQGNDTEELILNLLYNDCVWSSFLLAQTDVLDTDTFPPLAVYL